MVSVTIRGREFEASNIVDRYVGVLAAASQDFKPVDVVASEKNVCAILKWMIPSFPDEWLKGDRCDLHSTEMGVLVVNLQEGLASSKTFVESLEPLKSLPTVMNSAGKEINELQQEIIKLQQKSKGKGVKPRPPRSNQINHYR